MHPDLIISRQLETECHRWAELSPMERNHTPYPYNQAFDDCIDRAVETAQQNAHDEWWDLSAPEPWHWPYDQGIWTETDTHLVYVIELPEAA